jgi:hypothetical protein
MKKIVFLICGVYPLFVALLLFNGFMASGQTNVASLQIPRPMPGASHDLDGQNMSTISSEGSRAMPGASHDSGGQNMSATTSGVGRAMPGASHNVEEQSMPAGSIQVEGSAQSDFGVRKMPGANHAKVNNKLGGADEFLLGGLIASGTVITSLFIRKRNSL